MEMKNSETVSTVDILAEHYAPGNLLDVTRQAVAALNKNTDTVSLEDLAPMEEFHVGGREATRALLDPLNYSQEHHLLDIGCGVGGSARFVAREYGCRVTGFDLTAEFIDVGRELCRWTALHDRVSLRQGSVLDLPSDDASFDGAYMLHVGMNIKDKGGLLKEIARVLKPGAGFAVYDLMRIGEGDVSFPVPWSSGPATSFIESESDYRDACRAAGLTVQASRNRHGFALEFYRKMQQQIQEQGPQPMGLHLLMGETAKQKLENAYAAIQAGTLAPVELLASKPG